MRQKCWCASIRITGVSRPSSGSDCRRAAFRRWRRWHRPPWHGRRRPAAPAVRWRRHSRRRRGAWRNGGDRRNLVRPVDHRHAEGRGGHEIVERQHRDDRFPPCAARWRRRRAARGGPALSMRRGKLASAITISSPCPWRAERRAGPSQQGVDALQHALNMPCASSGHRRPFGGLVRLALECRPAAARRKREGDVEIQGD